MLVNKVAAFKAERLFLVFQLVNVDAVDAFPEDFGGLEKTRALLESTFVGEVLQLGLGCFRGITEMQQKVKVKSVVHTGSNFLVFDD